MASPMTEQGQGEKAACRRAREISTPRTSSTITTTPCTKKWMHLKPCFSPEIPFPSTSGDPSSSARWEEATPRRRLSSGGQGFGGIVAPRARNFSFLVLYLPKLL